jgi:FkbM family methyltransferase
VFAFEPEPENFGLLQRNVRCNGYGNVILIPKAVSDRSGTTSLFLAEHKGDARIFDSHDGRARIPVETVRLDDYFAEEERGVDFVKMDIQGAEPAAIKGMAKLLEKNNRTTLLLEFWPNGLKLFGVEPESFLRTLADLGFEFWRIDEQEARTVPTTAAELLNRYPARDDDFFNFTNLLCKRRGA